MVQKRPIICITCRVNSDEDVLSLHYAQVIEAADGTAIMLPQNEDTAVLSAYLSLAVGILLAGAGDPDSLNFNEQPHPKIGQVDPILDQMELSLIRQALDHDLPTFGVCRGAQMMNIAMGGTIFQYIPSQLLTSDVNHSQQGVGWYAAHTIQIETNSVLYQAAGAATSRVNSFHHQAIRDLASGFVVTATATDGVIEAIENPNHTFAVGVQFHPELMWQRHPLAAQLFKRFLDATA